MTRYACMMTLVVLLISCGAEDRTQEFLLGHWEVKEAIRQHRVTSTLEGLHFEFTRDSLFTNLPVLENYPYIYQNDTVTVLAKNPYKLQVFHVDSVQLDLRGEINNVLFFLRFEKIRP